MTRECGACGEALPAIGLVAIGDGTAHLEGHDSLFGDGQFEQR